MERKRVQDFDARYIGCHFLLFHGRTGIPVADGNPLELVRIDRGYIGTPASSVFTIVNNGPEGGQLIVQHLDTDPMMAECLGNVEDPVRVAGGEVDPEEERVAWGLMMDARDHIIASKEKFRAAVLAAARQMERDTGGLFMPLSVDFELQDVTNHDSPGKTFTVLNAEVRLSGGIR